MSANIYWEPISTKAKRLGTMAPSSFMSTLDRAGMALPNTFSTSDIPTLRGMAATMEGKYNPFNELIDAIEKNGEVNVWYEH